MDVAAWLDRLGLNQYAHAFVENDIDGETLGTLTAEDLKELGVSSLGHRKRLLAAIAELHEAGASAGAAPDAPPAAEGERRQVTVLFADLAGYTELTQEIGPERMHEFTGRFFELADGLIERHGGRVDKHMGDCVMAVFGAPIAHGNDAERAVRAALAIREQVPALREHLARPIDVHIGVASGQVVASGTGGAGRREYAVTGDSVNLASRLTDLAETGEILVSDAVRRLLPDVFECAERSEVAVKGIAAPVKVWRLIGRRSGASEPSPRPFVGRRIELGHLSSVLQGCLGDGRGQTVYVRGEAGIGKSRLVEEFERRAEAAGLARKKGLVLDFGTGAGQDAIRSIVRGLLDVSLAAERAETEEAASAAEARGLVDADRRVYLNDLLDLPQPVELRGLYDAMDSAARTRGKRDCLRALVERSSRARPLLLVVEDLHWADPLTLEHLATLATTVARCPAVLVLTSRIEGDPLDQVWRSSIGSSPFLTLDLGPMQEEDAEALAGAYLGASGAFARRCITRASGNPLFLEQLLRHAEEGGDSGVPGSIQSLVQARVDRLAPAQKQALQAASILGQRFGRDALAHLIGRADDCAALVAHYLIRPEGDGFLFAHALIHDAVYESLLSTRRRELHRKAAGWFGARDLVLQAEHLDRAEDPGAPHAYLEAARQEVEEYRNERALQLVERGRALAVAQADRVALTCLEGDILHDLGSMPEARAAYEAALEAAAEDRERCQAWLGLAAVRRVIDDLDGAFEALERAQAIAVDLNLTPERARCHFLRGNLYFPRGNIQGCLEEHGRSLELARLAGSPELEAAAQGGLGDAEYVRGRMISAYARFSSCVELCRRHGFGRIEVANFSMFGHTQLYFQPQGTAVADALAAAEAARRVGHRRAELNARLAAFFGLYEMARFEEASAQVDLALGLIRHLGAARFAQPCLLHRGKIALARGQAAEAMDILREALQVARDTGLGFHGPSITGALALAVESPDERRRLLDEGDDLIAAGCVGHNHLRYYPDAMDAAAALEDFERAEGYAQALEAYTGPEPLPWADFFIAKGRALAAHRRGERGEDLRRELTRLAGEAQRLDLALAGRAIDAALRR